jgi:hypothetical protein
VPKRRASLNELEASVKAYAERAKRDFEDRIRKWQTDLSNSEVHEVVGALLSRQLTLCLQLASCPLSWNGHAAPLFLRAMADVYIAFAWIVQDPPDRAKKFILHGLGQAKLELEHRRAELGNLEPEAGEHEYIQFMENWINRQRATFLTAVNLGSWSGLSTRSMASDAGCLDFYNYVYTPFSACVHSTWNHVERYNLKPCDNPLHRQHSIPAVAETPIDPSYLILAARYLQKTFAKFDEVFCIRVRRSSALDMLGKGLRKVERAQAASARRKRP